MERHLKRPVSTYRLQRFRRATIIFALGLIVPATRAASIGYSIISSYSGAETGLHSICFDTAQDDEGVLHFAGAGLLTFDGDRWKTIKIPESFAIRSLHFGSDGKLWAGASGDLGWFERTPASDWKFRSLHAKLPADDQNMGEVWGVFADNEGTTFVTTSHVLRWDGEQITTWKKTSDEKLYPSRSHDRIFVHQLSTGLYEVTPTGLRLLIPTEILGDAGVVWIEPHPADWLIGTSKGISIYDGKRLVPFAPAIKDFLEAGRLSCACRLPDGRIAVGTVRQGIAILRADGAVDFFITDKSGLPSPNITSLFVARDGGLWVTTGSHILRIDIREQSSVFDSRAGLPEQTYRKITKVNGSMFVTNESGAYELRPNENHFVAIESLPGRWRHVLPTPAGLVVSGFQGSSLWDGHQTRILHRTKYDVSTAANVRENPTALFLADHRSIVRLSPSGSPQLLVRDLPDLVSSIGEDIDGRLWIGTWGRGLFVASPTAGFSVDARNTADSFGLPRLIGPTHVRTNPAGTVMVFANNGAWQKPAGGREFVPVLNFPIRSLAAVSEMAGDGSVWVAHENTELLAPRIGRVSFRNQQARWEPHAVDGLLEVGAPCSIYADAAKPPETVLWIGGTHALLRHVVPAELSDEPPRPPLLRAFARTAADDTRAPIRAALPYSTELLEFEFAAPEFSRRSLLRIESRIEGVDASWTPVPPGSRRELTAIRDGNYTVKARVVAETGAVSSETAFSFIVLPPWWRTTPGIATSGLAAALLFLGAYRLRVRTLRTRNAALESKIRERTEQLERANAAKTQFVANMSHDIRNPLNGIVGLALALEDTRLDHRQREIVSTLRECTTYLSSLVDDVLDFASIEAGRVELRPRAFRPDELLRSIVETLKADATASGSVLSVELSDDVPQTLFGDAGRIQQILVNFVSNALKYAGGNIRLSMHAPASSPGEVEFGVSDHGPGIAAAEQSTLFTKFSRLRQQRGGEEIPGTGLGLAACRLLADIMGGAVGVESQVGNGARFYLRLPLAIATGPVAAPVACLPNTSVLLVEDTDYNAWAATAVLAKLGLSCERARTGEEALRLFGARPFHVVLLDRNLPDMDGTEVARRMRELESDTPQAVILAVTAYCTAEDRALCLQSGMDAFVGKPLTPEKLRHVLLDAGRRLLASASVQVSPEISAANIDMALLTYLSDGSRESLELQIRRFVATLHEAHTEMTAASQRHDFDGLGTAAHRLLGQARMIGCGSLAEAATRLEAAARSGDATTCSEWLRRIRDEIDSVTEAMRHPRSAAQSV
jgi:signal transduction histidine kinase/DNA-binding response OmpR family regulator/ligand-binding sensor domain-containing protein